MRRRKSEVMIDTVPLPDFPIPYEIRFSYDSLRVLGETVRLCVRLPGQLGIRVPANLVDKALLGRLGPSVSLLLLPGATQAIGTWPTPEHPLALEYSVSTRLLGALGKEIRLVVGEPWTVAATLPSKLLRPELAKVLGKNERVVFVPQAKAAQVKAAGRRSFPSRKRGRRS